MLDGNWGMQHGNFVGPREIPSLPDLAVFL